jgi:hypothetical protein
MELHTDKKISICIIITSLQQKQMKQIWTERINQNPDERISFSQICREALDNYIKQELNSGINL